MVLKQLNTMPNKGLIYKERDVQWGISIGSSSFKYTEQYNYSAIQQQECSPHNFNEDSKPAQGSDYPTLIFHFL